MRLWNFEEDIEKDMNEMNETANRATARRQWKIVSGGQTGVDRAGLSAALASGLPYGGWIPKGRRAEDGIVPGFYRNMKEHASASYPARTKANVRDSDATLVLVVTTPLSPGTQLTVDAARKFGRPFKVVCMRDADAVAQIRDWMLRLESTVRPDDASALLLNVAGPRESKSPGIFVRARQILVQVFASLRVPSSGALSAASADGSYSGGKHSGSFGALMFSSDGGASGSGALAAEDPGRCDDSPSV